MLEDGGGAGVQRRAYSRSRSLLEVVTEAIRVTHAQAGA